MSGHRLILKTAFTFMLMIAPMIVLMATSGCQNIFSDLANKTADDALLYQAKQQINATNYAAAITTIQSMTTSGQTARGTQGLLASAYAGSCGLNLLGLSTVLTGLGNNTLFQALLIEYKSGVAAQVTSCQSAETILSGFSARTADENLLLAFTELVKIGRVLSIAADSNHDGFVDAAYDPCGLSTADATAIGLGITTFLTSLSASGVAIADDLTASLATTCSTIDTAIAVATSTPGYSGFCAKTTFTATELQVFRSLTSSSEVGLKTCSHGTVDQCLCSPFP